MNRSEILTRVTEFLTETMDYSGDQVTEDAHLVDDLEIDSLSVLELAVFTEDEFDVNIEDAFKEALHRDSTKQPTVGWLVDLVHTAQANVAS